MKTKLTKFFPVFGLLLFAYILAKIDLGALVANFREMNIALFVIALFFTIPSVIVKTIKWLQLAKPFGKYPLKKGIIAQTIGFFLGIITPGRMGDLARSLYLREVNIPVGKGLTTVVLDRAIDILVLFLMALAGIGTVIRIYANGGNAFYVIAGFFILFMIGVYFFVERNRAEKIVKPIYNIFVPEKYRGHIKAGFHDFYLGVEDLLKRKGILIKVGFLSAIGWMISILQYYFLAMALHIEVSYFFLALAIPTIILVETLPISFAGIGTRDATMILFFSFAGIPASNAVALSLLILVFNYLYGLVGLFFWIKKPLKF